MKLKTKLKIVGIILLSIVGYIAFNMYILEHGKPWERYLAKKKIEAYLSDNLKGRCEITHLGYDLKYDEFYADIRPNDNRISTFRIKTMDGGIKNYYFRYFWESQIIEKCDAALLGIFQDKAYFNVIIDFFDHEKKYGQETGLHPHYDEVKEEISKYVSLFIELPYDWKDEYFEQEATKLYEALSFIKTNISFSNIDIAYKNKMFYYKMEELESMTNGDDMMILLSDKP